MLVSISKSWVKEQSINSDKPFSDILYEVMLEDLLFHTIPEEKPVKYVLRDDMFLTQPQLAKMDRVIRLCCSADLYLAKEEFIRRIEQSSEEIGWDIIDQDVSASNSKARLMLEGSLEEMKVPFVVEIEAKENSAMYLDLKSYKGPTRRIPLEYSVCAPEQKLSECFMTILTRLELIGSMDCYDDVYQILKAETVDGRRVADDLKLGLASKAGNSLMSRLKEYRNYRYMEKRWISYEKNKSMIQRKKFDSSWEEVMDIIISFLDPMMDSIINDTVFIGDWMPELGRFI